MAAVSVSGLDEKKLKSVFKDLNGQKKEIQVLDEQTLRADAPAQNIFGIPVIF